MLTDYKHYRDMIEDQVKKINAAFEKDTITETPEEAEPNEVGEQDGLNLRVVRISQSNMRSPHGALFTLVSNAPCIVLFPGVRIRRFSPT